MPPDCPHAACRAHVLCHCQLWPRLRTSRVSRYARGPHDRAIRGPSSSRQVARPAQVAYARTDVSSGRGDAVRWPCSALAARIERHGCVHSRCVLQCTCMPCFGRACSGLTPAQLPVRRLSHASPSRTWDLVRHEIETYALMFPNVAFTLEDAASPADSSHHKERVIRIPKVCLGANVCSCAINYVPSVVFIYCRLISSALWPCFHRGQQPRALPATATNSWRTI